jgi:hypothetical protein
VTDPTLHASLPDLLQQAGIDAAFELIPIQGGGNNRVFEVKLADRSLLLKSYFRHEQDPRDRLGAEFSFCQFAWEHGLRCIPRPFARNSRESLGLYEFIPGHTPTPREINRPAVETALRFFLDLNRHRDTADAKSLSVASEACFSMAEHLDAVNRRVKRLGLIAGTERIDREATRFVADRLVPTWERIRSRVEARSETLAPNARRISPSDFGFHNTIFTLDGHIRFIDFEYSGWDDPAKTVCDFFCQVALPAPFELMNDFAEEVTAGQSDPAAMRERIRTLLPVYQIKWCCIVLNDFLPADSARRRFAHGAVDEETRKARQLKKARGLMEQIRKEP